MLLCSVVVFLCSHSPNENFSSSLCLKLSQLSNLVKGLQIIVNSCGQMTNDELRQKQNRKGYTESLSPP